jgi:hypothetical protein
MLNVLCMIRAACFLSKGHEIQVWGKTKCAECAIHIGPIFISFWQATRLVGLPSNIGSQCPGQALSERDPLQLRYLPCM